ncbi:hypothetical protein MTR_4g105820 [Medicago truncatula]|uniref:Uncharacterized protein n=1 Tax=Medicago truncatula TaxID=3880 RepID=A0A072UQC9_MEDTR|nr:hypothetical protein MTR_4g105820 [Medicago truncatula]
MEFVDSLSIIEFNLDRSCISHKRKSPTIYVKRNSGFHFQLEVEMANFSVALFSHFHGPHDIVEGGEHQVGSHLS